MRYVIELTNQSTFLVHLFVYTVTYHRLTPLAFRDSVSGKLNLLGGENAENEPVPDCSLSRRGAGAGTYLTQICGTVLLAAQGFDNKTIGLKLNIPRQVVSRWRKRFFDLRLLGLQDRARPERPSDFPP